MRNLEDLTKEANYNYENMVFIDTETTGLGKNDEIIEIAVLDYTNKPIYHSFIKPTKPIPKEASLINNIWEDDVKNAPDFFDAWHEFSRYLYGKTLVFYNAEFDVRMIKQSLKLNGGTGKFLPYDCKVCCAMNAFSEYTNVTRWQRLIDAGAHFGIEIPQGIHRADVDAELTARITWAMTAAAKSKPLF